MTATPPMFYNDAMRAALGKAYRQGKEEATPAPALLTPAQVEALEAALAMPEDDTLGTEVDRNDAIVPVLRKVFGGLRSDDVARWLLAAHARVGGGA
jgi:hypothetical protein